MIRPSLSKTSKKHLIIPIGSFPPPISLDFSDSSKKKEVSFFFHVSLEPRFLAFLSAFFSTLNIIHR